MPDKKILGANEKYNYELAVKYLDIVLLAPRTVRLLKDDANFDQIINRTINIVAYYETNYETPTETATKFSQAYRTLTSKEITPEPNFDYHDSANVLDTINYITVFVRNITGMSWEEVENSLKPHEVEAEYVDDKNNDQDHNSNGNASQGGSSQDSNGGETPPPNEQNTSSGFNFNTQAGNYYGGYQDNVSDSIILQQATLLLNRRILNGKVYQYKEKPVVIPIMKYIMVAALILMTLIALISFAVLAVLGHDTHLIANAISVNTNGNTITGTVSLAQGSWSSSIYFPYQFIFFAFIAVFGSILILRGLKNDNYKYHFPWGWMLFYIVIILLVTFINSGTTSYMVFHYNEFMSHFYLSQTAAESYWGSSILANNPIITKTYQSNAPYVGYVNAVRGLQFVIYALIIICVAVLIVAIVFNPKKDLERLQGLVQQYADDIRYGRINPEDFEGPSGVGGFFGMI